MVSRAARTMSRSGVYHILFRGVNQQNIFEEKADYEKLKEAIEKLLNDPSYRETAKEYSEDMKSLGGTQATADAIVAFLEKNSKG